MVNELEGTFSTERKGQRASPLGAGPRKSKEDFHVPAQRFVFSNFVFTWLSTTWRDRQPRRPNKILFGMTGSDATQPPCQKVMDSISSHQFSLLSDDHLCPPVRCRSRYPRNIWFSMRTGRNLSIWIVRRVCALPVFVFLPYFRWINLSTLNYVRVLSCVGLHLWRNRSIPLLPLIGALKIPSLCETGRG